MECGDDVINGSEICDDGASNGTYTNCNDACTADLVCGDGVITDPPEACDDNNTTNYDGCSSVCATEATGTIACSNGDFNFGTTTASGSSQVLSDSADAIFQCVDMS